MAASDNEVLEDVQKELKALGDDINGIGDSMKRDLDQVRKLAEEAPKAVLNSGEFKDQVRALTTAVGEKHDALNAKVKEIEEKAIAGASKRLDELEKKLNRTTALGGWGDSDDGKDAKSAFDFAKAAKAIKGELKLTTDLSSFNRDEVKAYAECFQRFMRRDQNAATTDDFKTMAV